MNILKKKLTPERTVKILEKHGTIISLKEVQMLLEFIEKIGKFLSSQGLRRDPALDVSRAWPINPFFSSV